MNRTEVEKFIAAEYGVTPDYLWDGDYISAALRHPDTKRWFGVLMRVPATKLNIFSEGDADILDIKLDPDFILELQHNLPKFYFPAYHMNKKHWVTVLLSDQTDRKLLETLIRESYLITSN